MNTGFTILIVDDEKNTREGLKQFLERLNYDVVDAASGKEAIQQMRTVKPDVVLTDLKMPDMDGIEVLHAIHRLKPDTLVILLTAYGTVENAVQAMKAGAYYYLTKPINLEELELILKKALHQKSIEFENRELKEELMKERHEIGTIIGNSEKIKEVIESAKQVAKSDSAVLIQGESGTGKELFAHLIHAESLRANESFVTVHMASLTDTLLASELFGHERGSFTGATERKIGRFERAHRGTLFLDEVSEIPELMQTKLLRVLQTGEFERVGGSKTLHSDVRLVCATNKNLEEQVKKGKFRGDLFYRINVILLEVPPLRERPEDIPLLANHYLRLFAAKNRKQISGFSQGTLDLLSLYGWPGNVRELKNIVERIVVLSNTEVIEPSQIPQDIKAVTKMSIPPATHTIHQPTKENNLQKMEADLIKQVLHETNFNKSLAAKQLGISRRTLYRKIEEYKLEV